LYRQEELATDVLPAEVSLASQPGNEWEVVGCVAAVAEKITASQRWNESDRRKVDLLVFLERE
jgi:hypothetical protein